MKNTNAQLALIPASAPAATYFYSGSNHQGEINGLAEMQRHIGVAVHELDRSGRALEALCSLPQFPVRRVVANVQRNSSGKPIIMITRDRALLPQGDETVSIGGESYVAGFRKIAVNVARKVVDGVNELGEALAKLGMPRQVVIQLTRVGWEITTEQLDALKASGSQVFVDSGAFSEVETEYPFNVVAPISDAEWTKRLAAMTKIAEALGPKAYLVAPDMVGHQDETLERLTRYAETVRHWRAVGANVIVVLQKGRLSQLEMDGECQRILGFADYIRGIPSKKAAATTAEIAELANALPVGTRLHLLGLGVEGDRYAEILAVMPHDRPLFCDSVGIKRLVGRTNGRGGGRRILTAIRDAIVAEWGVDERTARKIAADIKAEMMRRYFTACPDAA